MAILDAARTFALTLPGAFEDHPWGECVVKVAVGSKSRIFVFLGGPGDDRRGMGVKLPETGLRALERDDAEPSGYGLGKSGWVSFGFTQLPPDDAIQGWVLESYRAVAPKKLVRQLG